MFVKDGRVYEEEMVGGIHVSEMDGVLGSWINGMVHLYREIACACCMNASFGIAAGRIHSAMQAGQAHEQSLSWSLL